MDLLIISLAKFQRRLEVQWDLKVANSLKRAEQLLLELGSLLREDVSLDCLQLTSLKFLPSANSVENQDFQAKNPIFNLSLFNSFSWLPQPRI
jgi:hypothetical protein